MQKRIITTAEISKVDLCLEIEKMGKNLPIGSALRLFEFSHVRTIKTREEALFFYEEIKEILGDKFLTFFDYVKSFNLGNWCSGLIVETATKALNFTKDDKDSFFEEAHNLEIDFTNLEPGLWSEFSKEIDKMVNSKNRQIGFECVKILRDNVRREELIKEWHDRVLKSGDMASFCYDWWYGNTLIARIIDLGDELLKILFLANEAQCLNYFRQ